MINYFPISAILPIYNCRERLQRHLRSVVTWAPSVHEIIVVDSGSTDGTLELVQEVLTPAGARFIHNPPGLYQSWNAGIAAATSPWCYISTVEDPITPEGLTHLLEVATQLDADVTISPPEMRNHNGSKPVDEKMPSNRLAEAFISAGLAARLLSRAETVANLCSFLPHGLLGSSASNLYRTTFLQQHPFPTDFCHCGDTAWGAIVAPFAQVAFTPTPCARFYCQTEHTSRSREQQRELARKLSNLAIKSLDTAAESNPELASLRGWLHNHSFYSGGLWELLAEHQAYQEHLQAKYDGGILQYFKRAVQDEWKKLLK
jgi:glycosyltransferase involved in cell wall biosynthesis